MDDQFDRFYDKIDKLDSRLESIGNTLVRQEEQLKEHMRRTDLAEESIRLIRKDLKPIEAHVDNIKGAIKLLSILALILSIITGIAKVLKLI